MCGIIVKNTLEIFVLPTQYTNDLTWKQIWLKCCSSPPPPALMWSWERDRVRGTSWPSGSVGLCRMSCRAFLRPVLAEAMKSAYVASTSDIAHSSSTQRSLPEEQQLRLYHTWTHILRFSSIYHTIKMNFSLSKQCGYIKMLWIWYVIHVQ